MAGELQTRLGASEENTYTYKNDKKIKYKFGGVQEKRSTFFTLPSGID